MKELTYEEWLKNPVPRNMWVWDNSESKKVQRKVIYFEPKLSFPIFVIASDGISTDNFKHCAEIESKRRMTKKELSRWLREKPTREFKYSSFISCSVYSTYTYYEDDEDEEVRKDIRIRENDGEWKEPLIEVEL